MQIVKYFFVGGAAAVVNIGIFFIFAKIFGFFYLAVNIVAFLIATLVNYLLSIKFVFTTQKRYHKKKEVFLVYLVSAIGLLLDSLFLYIFIETLHIDMLISKLISTALVFIWNYTSRKYFIF